MKNWRRKLMVIMGLVAVLPISPTIFIISLWINS